MSEPVSLSGHIESILFVHPENQFTIAKLKEPHKKEYTVIVGTLPSIQPGETIVCKGIWKIHPQYGKQLEVSDWHVEVPSDVLGIQKYLESGLIDGIGPVFAEKIVNKFGVDALKVIDETPDRLLEIPGIGPLKIKAICACWLKQRAIRDVMVFLRSHGISSAYAQKIFQVYGNQSIEKVQADPYQLAKDIFGIGFKIADSLAQKLGTPFHSPQRIAAGILYMLWQLTEEGHTCYPELKLVALTAQLLGVADSSIQEQLEELLKSQEITRAELEGVPTIWLRLFFIFEQGIAKELHRLQTSLSLLRSFDKERACAWAQDQLQLCFAPQQTVAIQEALATSIHVITGGPGTGKSTITKAILSIGSKLTDRIALAAPTGRAAKRLSEITRHKASTLHALLEWEPVTGGFQRCADHPLNYDLVLVDEASMIDTRLLFSLLRAIPSGAKLVLIGDIDQLPSVGPGTVLRDIISSGKVGVTQLTEIFRQAQGSHIVINAHRINRGEFPHLTSQDSQDFHFLEIEDAEGIKNQILELVSKTIPARWGFDPMTDIQVLAPMKRGVVGIEMLNDALQQTLNPSKIPFMRNGRRFHIQDKVMQIRNDYQKNVFNGDIGRVVAIDTETQMMRVLFDDRLVIYPFTELEDLVLAYAVSVHKYQGSECPCIVLPLHPSHFKLLQRNLLYTAVTRSKKQLYLVGTQKAIQIAIQNNEAFRRHTGLKSCLIDLLRN